MMAIYGGCGSGGGITSQFLCGAGSLNVAITNTIGSNDLDTSAFAGNSISATTSATVTEVDNRICNATSLRSFAFHLGAALANGTVYQLTPGSALNTNFASYTQTDHVAGGTVTAQWIADSGTVTVNNVTSSGFSYTLAAHFKPNTINGITQASGTFDANGTGQVIQYTH